MNFDLNIQNYKKPELEEIFELPQGYNISIIELKESALRDGVNNDTNISIDIRNKTLLFLSDAKNILKKDLESEKKISDITKYNIDYTLKQSDILTASANHNVTEHIAAPFSYSFPSEYYKGVINPLKKRITHQNLSVDTQFRDNYYKTTSTNFHLDLPIKFSNVLSMQLVAFEFSTSFYIISKNYGNNFFCIRSNDQYQIITIPNGNYSPESIRDYLNDFMKTKLPTSSPFNNIVFEINIDNGNGSGQMIIGRSSPPNIPINFILDFQCDINGNPDTSTPLLLKFGWIIGFRNGIYINNSSYVSEGIIDLNHLKCLYLVVNDYNNNVSDGFYGAFTSSILNKNILARLSIYNIGLYSLFSLNSINTLVSLRQYFGPVNIQKLEIQLLDQYGRIVDLNNMDYSFCLHFESAYDI